MSAPRQVDQGTAGRIAKACLGRMACAYNDPKQVHYDHDHDFCVVDDEAYIADGFLALLNEVVAGDDDTALNALLNVRAAIRPVT